MNIMSRLNIGLITKRYLPQLTIINTQLKINNKCFKKCIDN